MAAEPLKTISFLPHPSKEKPLRTRWEYLTTEDTNSGRAMVAIGCKSHAVVISPCDLTSLDVRKCLQCGEGVGQMAGARGLAEKHQPQRTPRTAIKKTNPHLTLSPTMTSFFPVPARSVKGSLFPNSVPSAFSVASKVAERMLTVCAEFQRERVEPPFLGRVS